MLTRLTVLLVLLATASRVGAAPVLITKDNYKSAADSPFDLAGRGYYLEDFEDGLANAPGLRIDPRFWGTEVLGPAGGAASVDEDGWSIRTNQAIYYLASERGPVFTGLAIEFDEHVLGGLPTDVGFVFTEADVEPDFLEFFVRGDGWGASLEPTYALNRFVGVHSDRGIKYLDLRMDRYLPSDLPYFQADHIQYGGIVPEPSAAFLLALGCLVLAARRRR